MRHALLVLALAACHPALPPAEGCRTGAYVCRGDRPYVCSATGRYEPAGDTTCAAVGAACSLLDGGVAACAPAARDGGAP